MASSRRFGLVASALIFAGIGNFAGSTSIEGRVGLPQLGNRSATDTTADRAYDACVRAHRIYDRSRLRAQWNRMAARNRVQLTHGGEVIWNGVRVDLAILHQYLDLTMEMKPVPLLIVDVEPGTPLQLTEDFHAVVSRSYAC